MTPARRGLTIGLVGIDLQTGQQRLTFGIPQLADGIDVVVVAVGLFGLFQLHTVNAVTKEIREGWLPRIELLGKLKLSKSLGPAQIGDILGND